MCGQLCSGANLETAISQGVINALPVPESARKALQQADALALDLAHGKRIDKSLLAVVGNVANLIPNIDPGLRSQLVNVAKTGVSLAEGAPPEQALMSALRGGVADSLVSLGSKALPPGVTDVLDKGMAVGNAVLHQARKVEALVGSADKLVKMGEAFAGSNPLVGAARKLCDPSQLRGFDLGQGLTSQAAKLFDVTAARNTLKNQEQALKGFDMALSARVGMVAHPIPTHLPVAAQAAHAMTLGTASQHPANAADILQTMMSKPGAAAGIKLAVSQKACSATTAAAFRATCMHPGA
jgi:hypothetical protein